MDTPLGGGGEDGRRILIIEDEPDIRLLESRILGDDGWTVATAPTGTDGLARALDFGPNVIICDSMLPDVNGPEVLVALKEDVRTEHIPVVFVSAVGPPQERARVLDLGAHDYMLKPFAAGELRARALAALRVSRQRRDLDESHARLEASERRYRQMVDLATEGIWVVDAEGRTTFANRRMAEILGVEVAEMMDRPVFDFMDDDGVALATKRIERRRAGLSESGDFTFVRADGTRIWTMLNAAPVVDDNGNPRGSIALVSDVTERHDQELALGQSEARYRALLDHLPDTIAVVFDHDLRVVLAAGAGLAAREVRPDEVIGRGLADIADPADAAALEALYCSAFDGTARTAEFHSQATGTDNWLDVVPIIADGKTSEVLVVARDVTRLKDRERILAEAEQRWRAAFDDAPVGMAQIGRDGNFARVNDALCDLLGYSEEVLVELSPAAVSHPDDAARARSNIAAMFAGQMDRYRDEKRYLRPDGQLVWASVSARSVLDASGRVDHLLVHYLDVTDSKRLVADLADLATHDPLTGLLNRRGFVVELGRQVALATRYDGLGAVLMLDLDRFKAVNDTLGHARGDDLLALVAEALRHRLRSSDTLARLGGDEFAIILPHADRETAALVGESIVAVIGSIALAGSEVTVGASIGVALIGEIADGVDVLELADRRMYAAKAAGRNRCVIDDAG